ncbi:MAG TPA: ThiF family adenylyltransferase [Tepidisphaeraceae bacterium]|jgi:sulfur carrier protein ThiS adenylyltransferase|nr:ThiF family adenylyltransferase [Tepidisphaeraceae bacterium]
MSVNYPDRDIRQRDLVPPDRLATVHAVVVGVGAIGRQVALQLAATGVPAMQLIDHDFVAVENLAPQGYWPEDLGAAKVDATGRLCQRIHPELQFTCHADRFRRSTARLLDSLRASGQQVALFCAVDSITTRKLIWETAREHVHFFADGRMSAEVIRTLASGRPSADDYYATTLFGAEQAYAGSCTAKSTLYAASIAAGLMVGQFARWLRGLPTDRDLTINLLSAELSAA